MRRAFVLVAIVAAAAGIGGCNLVDSGTNLVNGKEQFVANCGACHVLNRAGTRGVTGPNLDEAFQRARKDGFGQSTFEGLVHAQILHPAINPQYDPVTRQQAASMPAKLVTGAIVRLGFGFWRGLNLDSFLGWPLRYFVIRGAGIRIGFVYLGPI